jgi:NAD(P)-dependent dehydrogenase (short-subunit alcohol dehydrogenase family)
MRRVALVTGGARGLGLGICRTLIARGVVERVVALDLDPTDAPADLEAVACDVQDETSVRAAFDALGLVPDVLVNNAGGARMDGPADSELVPFDPFAPMETWRQTIDLNLSSAHLVTRVVGPHLQPGAAICNTASIAGIMPGSLFAYGAAKAGLIHWTKSLALALAPRGIRVNAVAPGLIYTRLWETLAPERSAFDAAVKMLIPMGTEQTAVDIGEAVAYLCSAAAAQVTGQVIAIDGGATLGRPPTQ